MFTLLTISPKNVLLNLDLRLMLYMNICYLKTKTGQNQGKYKKKRSEVTVSAAKIEAVF